MGNQKSSKPTRPPTYAVGRGKPPKHSQFKPGRSGNPSGRPKGAKNKLKGSTATLREMVLKEALTEVELNISGNRESLPIMQGILKQNNVKALKGNTAAARLALTLAQQAAREDEEGRQREENERLEVAHLAQRIKKYWTEEIRRRRKRRETLDLPIPHPDHISINPEILEVTVKGLTRESVNALIDMIGKIAKLEADSLAFGSVSGLWTERMIGRLPCKHIRENGFDLSVPVAPARLYDEGAALHVFRTMFGRELPGCDHASCGPRNDLAEGYLRDFACYVFGRTIVPASDPLWREYGPNLVNAYLDQTYFYGPEPDVEALKVSEASLPDPRHNQFPSEFQQCDEEVEFREMIRNHIRDDMGDDWYRRFEQEFLIERNVDLDYLRYCKAQTDDPDQEPTADFVKSIEWPSFLNRFRREDIEAWLVNDEVFE